MGRPEHAYSSILGHGEATSPFGGPSPPLSGASSPSPLLLPANAKRSSAGRRRHVIARLICSPFAAVFRSTACARASATTNDNHQATKRPSLEDLLRMEASSTLDLKQPNEPDMADSFDDSSWKEGAIVVFDFGEDGDTSRTEEEEDEAPPLVISKDQHAAIHVNEQQTAIIPAEELHLGGPVEGLGAGAAVLSPTVPMNVKRLVLVLAALRALSRALKGSYGGLAGRHAGGVADKAELFYDRPIPLGRRCRVQHLEETPYTWRRLQ